MKTRISENQKITLTIGQLKRLVKESDDEKKTSLDGEGVPYIYEKLDEAVNALRSAIWAMDEDDKEMRNSLEEALKKLREARKIYYTRFGVDGVLNEPRLYPHKMIKKNK